MLSRVANSIYWISRYIERAENAARLIDVNLQLTLDRESGMQEQWSPLLGITGDQSAFHQRYDAVTRANVMRFLTVDPLYANSIATCIALARENARTVREVITSEMWQQINAMNIMVRQAAESRIFEERPHEFYTEVKRAAQLFNAVTDDTMTHGIGWDFARVGRMVERADQTSRILDVKYFLLLPNLEDIGGALDVVQWSALLRSAGALEMYRQAHGAIHPDRVAAFLMLDRDFPRSMTFCLLRAEASLHRIIGPNRTAATDALARRLGRIRSSLEFGDITEIIHAGLHESIDHFQLDLNRFGDAINRTFFHAEDTTQTQQQS